ncbi:hypothetical protein DH2020_025043 [Rehmannia glutinosa]|uniref:VQ domain-containing protein n=1 Tax=Rehmannia glutinosa TaxID=99300 RepID=A0ABR0W0T7_REHGL
MGISEPMSNPSDWTQLYQTNFTDIGQIDVPLPTTTATTTATTTTTTVTSRNNNLTPDQGRIAKPIRRRSRASRRTPTTLLNTDTTNFRAMVQQFTGGGPSTTPARSQLSDTIGTFGFTRYNPSTTMFMSPASGFHVQYPNHMQQQQQHTFMINNMHGGVGGGGGNVSSHAPPGSSSTNENMMSYDNYML